MANINGDLGNILNFLSAAAALGTASMGLVDATKVFGGGPSNFGFGYIRSAVEPFLTDPPGVPPAFGKSQILRTLRAAWINGVATADQKAKAKALIHLHLVKGNATALATAAGVDPAILQSLADKTAGGEKPSPEEINALGQFDVVLSAILDAGYERGDQKYRNSCKVLAMLVSACLGVAGGGIVFGITDYFGHWPSFISFLVGFCATPLAPIAKDLASSLQAAASAVQLVKR